MPMPNKAGERLPTFACITVARTGASGPERKATKASAAINASPSDPSASLRVICTEIFMV
jgi:hypothetical protein